MPKRKQITVAVTLSVKPDMSKADAVRELRTLVNEQCNFHFDPEDVRVRKVENLPEQGVVLTDWEMEKLRAHASSNALTYFGHYAGAGLFRTEIGTLNAWEALAAKLRGDPPPTPHEYRGIARNGFNPQGKD